LENIERQLKKTIHRKCSEALENRIQGIREALDSAQESANQETKSSAGDKHETGRAMMQLETEKLHEQLRHALDDLHRLQRLEPDKDHQTVGEGALVKTDRMHLYFTVAGGTFEVEGTQVITLSMGSGLGLAARGLKAGESFSFRDQAHKILDIY